MFHPLSGNFTQLTDEQISAKINQLYKVISHCRNIDIGKQAQMILDELREEQRTRQEKKVAEEMDKSGAKFEDIININ